MPWEQAPVDAQIVGHEIQLPHGVARAEILATCLACLVDLGESTQKMSSRCGRSRTAKACVAVSRPPRFTNATAQGTRRDISMTCNGRLSIISSIHISIQVPTRPQKPLAIHSDHSTLRHLQRHPQIIQHAIPLRPHHYHCLRWHHFGQPCSFASTSRQAHWRTCFGFSHSVFRTDDMCRPQHRESCRMPM
jgi:hypothetical protein